MLLVGFTEPHKHKHDCVQIHYTYRDTICMIKDQVKDVHIIFIIPHQFKQDSSVSDGTYGKTELFWYDWHRINKVIEVT